MEGYLNFRPPMAGMPVEAAVAAKADGAPRREFRKLRVSLTRSCNFRCVYCAHDGKAVVDRHHTPAAQFASWISEIEQFSSISKIRLTGGEPTLYPELLALVHELSRKTAAELSMTTNGHRLASLAGPLRDAGMRAINVSLDAVDAGVFRAMGGKRYADVTAGVRQAVRAGFQVRLNATLVREINDREVLPLLRFARSEGVTIRFLELMEMGHLHQANPVRLVSGAEILAEIGREHQFVPLGRLPSETAHYYEMPDGYRFGIVGNTSMPFCSDCDRLRLDSLGRIYGCLSNAQGIQLGMGKSAGEALEQAMSFKQPQKFTGSALLMREVGG